MGICYYCVCHDCKEYIDLDKFYSWSAYSDDDSGYADIDKEDFDDYKNDGFIYRSLRLHYFIAKHPGHRIEVLTENHFETDNLKEVYPWPSLGIEGYDEIDFTDPKSGRIVIKTSIGNIFIDKKSDGINCFRTVGGKRVDTMLLKDS